MEDEDDNVSDSTVLLDDYQCNPDKIAAKRRKLAANYYASAPVTSENATPDDDNVTINIQTDSANSSLLGENNKQEYHQWRVSKYFNSIDNVQKANEDVYSSKDFKIKRELLKQEIYSNQTEDIKEHDLSNNIEGDSNEEDAGVIVIEDSDDGCVAYEAKDNNDPNSQASSDVLPGPYMEKFSNVSRIRPKPSKINGRRSTINHFENNETAWNSTNIQNNQPRLKVLQPAAINARRATIDISELTENFHIETEINNRNNNETENLTENVMEPRSNEPPVVNETSNATNETNIVIKDSQSNDESRLKHTHATNGDTLKTDIIRDSFAVDIGVKGVISNPELTSPHQNNNNVATQRTQHKHILKSGKNDKKKNTRSDENSSLNATNNEVLCNKGVDSTDVLTRGSVSDCSFTNTNPREEVVNIYVNANEISRKRLCIDITSEEGTKRKRNSIDQSNNAEHIKNTEINHTPEKEDVHMETNDSQVFDAPNKNKSNNKENNLSVTNDEGNSEESLMYGEIKRVINFQVGFCTLLKGNLEAYCQIHSKDSEKVKTYLKSAESLTNEIESLQALAHDRRVKADIQYACPMCNRVSTYSASLLFSNIDNHHNVETNGEKSKFCREVLSVLYNSCMNKYLQQGKNKPNNGSDVESNINVEITQENYQLTHAPSNTYDDANNRDLPVKPVENIPGRESRHYFEESNNTVDSIPEADTLDTCLEKDAIEQNNNCTLGGVTSSEAIVESNNLMELQCNINTNKGNISASAETNTSVDILEDVSPKEKPGLNVTKDNIDHLNSTDNLLDKLTKSRTSVIRIVCGIDRRDYVNNNKVASNIPDTSEKEANNTIEKNPCEVTLPNIVSTTINSDNEDHRGEMADNLDSETVHRLTNEEANTLQSTTNVDTPTNITIDELPNVLRNTSNNSERNASRYTESCVSGDSYVISKNFCKKIKDRAKIGSTNLKKNHKRKMNNHGLNMVFKRVRPNVAAVKTGEDTSSHKDDESGQNSSNNPEDGNEPNTCEKKKAYKHADANGKDISNIGDSRSHTENVSDNVILNESRPEDESYLIRIRPTDAHTVDQNINDASNKSSDKIQQIVEDNEKQSTSNFFRPSKARENFDTSKTNKPNEVNKKPNSEHRDSQTLPKSHELNDTETEDQRIGVANKLSDVDTTNRQARGVNKKGESINNVHKELLESRKENEKNKTSKEINVSDNRRQDTNDEARRLNESNHEDGGETETADTDDEGNENSTDESDTCGDESNNTIRKTLEKNFEKIKRNLNTTAPPAPQAANSNVKPHKDLENKVATQDKLDIKCQTQYVCNICTCVFIYGGRFLHHMIENHNMDLTKIPKQCVIRKCSFCHVFLKENAINLHVKKYHPDEYLKDGDAIRCEKKSKVIEQNNEVKDVRKNELFKKDGKWRYICLICNVTVHSDYLARKHRKDKHPDMKNKKLYDKISVDEINESNIDESHKTSRGDCDPKNTKKDSGEIFRDREHDSKPCSEDDRSEYETGEETDKDYDEDSNSEENCEKENEQSSSGNRSEDKDESSGDDSDAECHKSSGSESSLPINEKDQENTQKSYELSNDEDHGITNEDNSDRSSSSDEDMEYDNNHSSEEENCDAGEINRRDEKEQNVSDENSSEETESTSSYGSGNDCSGYDVDAECGNDGKTGINLGETSFPRKMKNGRRKLRVNELNSPRENKKHAATKISKVKYYFECTICELKLNTYYAVHKHRKEKHPNMKNKKFIVKKVISEYDKSNTAVLNCEIEQTTRDEDGSDLNSCSDTDHTDENNSDSEYDVNEINGEERNVIAESGQRSEEDVDENSDSEPERNKNDDSSDARSSSSEDIEYDPNRSSEEANCDEGEINIRDEKEHNMTHQEGTSDEKLSEETESTSSDGSSNDCSGDDVDAECDKDGTTGINLGETSFPRKMKNGRRKLRVNELNSPRENKKHAATKISKVKYYFECTICELNLNSYYAVHKHRKEKHPNMKNKKFIVKKVISEYDKSNTEVLNCEIEQTTRDEDGGDLNSCSDTDHTDEKNSDSEYDGNEINGEERNVIAESNQRSEEDVDENSHSEPERNKNDDSSDARSSSSDEDIEYDPNRSSEEANCDEGEINRRDEKVHNMTHQEGTSDEKLSEETESTSSDGSSNDCSGDDVDAECDKDGTTGINLGEANFPRKMKNGRTKLRVNELNAPRENKKHAAITISKVKYYFECTICELKLNSYYAVHKHRKEKHPDMKKKKFIVKKVKSEYDKSNNEDLNCEIEQTTRDEDGRDLNTCSDTDHTDENNSDSEYDVNEINGEERNVIAESGQRSEEDADENSDSEPESNKNDDSSDANDEEYTYECTACKVPLDSGYAVRKHRKDVHPDEKNKRLIHKTLTITKNQQDIVQSSHEELQATIEDNMGKDENTRHNTGKEHINSDNIDNRYDVNTSRRDEITEQCYDSKHKINEKSQNPSFNDHVKDKSKNDRSENHTKDKSTRNATAEPPSFNKNIDKNVDQDKNTINALNAYKCILCKEYFQSGYYMRIHREREHPLMNNVKIFEKVVKNCVRKENSTKNVEWRVEEASKVNNATDKESHNNITEISTVQKLTNARDESGSMNSRKNVVTDETVKTDENVRNVVENVKEHVHGKMHQNSTYKNNTDESTCKKDSLNSSDQEAVFKKIKKANKHDQEHKEQKENNGNSSDVRKARFSNCHVCAINFDVNEKWDHECTLRDENDVLYNCYACGVNFMNNMEHLCSDSHETWIENIQISNVVTIKDSYVFTCMGCKYSTDVYDDVVKHCQNHYLEVVDSVTYCGICKLNFDEHRYSTHHNLHARFEVVKFSYTSLFCDWDAIFDDIPGDVATELKTQTIYTTHSIRMVTVENGLNEYSLYQCDQCKSCVPKHEIEKHCLSKCSEMNYVCAICDRAFISYEMCVNHEVSHRNGAKIFRVIAFNRKEDRKFNLKLIQSRELRKKDIKPKTRTADLFQCHCDLSFVSMANFKMHFLECNSNCRNGILCPKCPVKRNFLVNELDRHLQLHHGEIIYEFLLNQIHIRRSIEPNEVKYEFDTTEPNEPASTELDADEVKLKNELLKQEDEENTIVISDDDN